MTQTPEQQRQQEALARKNKRVMMVSLTVVAVMIAMCFASVPLYREICKVTGWGGTTRTQLTNPNTPVAGHKITVRFDANVAQGMPWHFKPDVNEVTLDVGADGIVSFMAENPTDHSITGSAVYNVTPLKAGKYFNKTQCFCFNEQILEPHKLVHMPVVFFVDPEILKDPELQDLTTITLSYTFFKAGSPELDRAIDDFTNEKPLSVPASSRT